MVRQRLFDLLWIGHGGWGLNATPEWALNLASDEADEWVWQIQDRRLQEKKALEK